MEETTVTGAQTYVTTTGTNNTSPAQGLTAETIYTTINTLLDQQEDFTEEEIEEMIKIAEQGSKTAVVEEVKIKKPTCNISDEKRSAIQSERRLRKKININSFAHLTKHWKYVPMIIRNGYPVFIDVQTKSEIPIVLNANLERIVTNHYQNIYSTKYTPFDYRLNFYYPVKDPIRLGIIENFVIVDFEKLIDSKGKIFQIKYKQGISYRALKGVHSGIKKMFVEAEKGVARLHEIHRSIFHEDNLDYMVSVNPEAPTYPRIRSCIKVDDITIRNSIELEKYIGTMFIFIDFLFISDKMYVNSEIKGLRYTHTPIDLMYGYSHSHLPTSSGGNFDRFCLGSDNHMFSGVMRSNHNTSYLGFGYYSISELELESSLLGLIPYLSWESLEGGPHIRIENTKVVRETTELCKDRYIFDEYTELYFPDNYATLSEITRLFEMEKDEIMKAYSLKKVRNGFEYTYDERRLYNILSEVTRKHNIAVSKYSYDLEKHRFFQLDGVASKSFKEIQERIKSRLDYKIPIFFKNQNIKPCMIDEDQINSMVLTVKSVPHPFYVRAVADAIVFILNKQLYDEYRKRQ